VNGLVRVVVKLSVESQIGLIGNWLKIATLAGPTVVISISIGGNTLTEATLSRLWP